jgi:hypothetical protein
MRRRDLLVTCLLLLAGGPAAAQSQAVLRFVPELGRLTRTLTEVKTTTSLVGFPAVPDRAAFEEEALIGVTQRVARMVEDGAVVEVTIDSIRGRARLGGEPWVDYADSTLIGGSAQAVISPQFAVVGIRSTGPRDGEILQALGAFAAGLDLAFPEAAVTAGETFVTGGRVRARVRTDRATGIAIDEVVFGDLSLTLDSAVQAGPDHLAYLHFQGALTPRTAAVAGEGGDVVTALSGGFAGRLVWSEQWGAFVSGVVRIRVTGRIQVQTPRGRETAEAIWDRTVVHRVRP